MNFIDERSGAARLEIERVSISQEKHFLVICRENLLICVLQDSGLAVHHLRGFEGLLSRHHLQAGVR